MQIMHKFRHRKVSPAHDATTSNRNANGYRSATTQLPQKKKATHRSLFSRRNET